MGFQLPKVRKSEGGCVMTYIPGIVVDKVTKTGSVDDGESKTDTVFLNVWGGVNMQRRVLGGLSPALMLSMATVVGLSVLGGMGSFGG